MKKLILTLALCFVTLFSYAQGLTGFSENVVRMSHPNSHIDTGTVDGRKCLQVTDTAYLAFYFLGKDKKVEKTAIVPLSDKWGNDLVASWAADRNFVKIDDRHYFNVQLGQYIEIKYMMEIGSDVITYYELPLEIRNMYR